MKHRVGAECSEGKYMGLPSCLGYGPMRWTCHEPPGSLAEGGKVWQCW